MFFGAKVAPWLKPTNNTIRLQTDCDMITKTYFFRHKKTRFRVPTYQTQLILIFNFSWLREPDLNRRPSGYEPDELPGCSIPRLKL